MTDNQEHIDKLRDEYQKKNLALYLGAGVSVDSGLPSWDQLVAAMYFSGLEDDSLVGIRSAFSNYLMAISDWYIDQSREPPGITAQKVQALIERNQVGGDDDHFVEQIRLTLYASLLQDSVEGIYDQQDAINRNTTLDAILELCHSDTIQDRSVRSVITYNYDNLLEMGLESKGVDHFPIFRNDQTVDERLPVYHVHGYVPMEGNGENRSTSAELVFTEEQFHQASHRAYSWSNLVQLQCMSNFTGVAVGLSLTDPNMRRLLDAASKTPLPPTIYAILIEETVPDIDDQALNRIRDSAESFLLKSPAGSSDAGMKRRWQELDQVERIVRAVYKKDSELQSEVLKKLGVQPIWVEQAEDVASTLKEIL